MVSSSAVIVLVALFGLSSATWQDFAMMIPQAERLQHRIAVQIDAKEFAGIAVLYQARAGWMFSKIPVDSVFNTAGEGVIFVGTDQRPFEEDKAYLVINEDYRRLNRVPLKGFTGCTNKEEPFHIEDSNKKKHYLMAVKSNLADPSSEKVIGTYILKDKTDANIQEGTFYGQNLETSLKMAKKIPSKMTPDHAELFCVDEHQYDWSIKK